MQGQLKPTTWLILFLILVGGAIAFVADRGIKPGETPPVQEVGATYNLLGQPIADGLFQSGCYVRSVVLSAYSYEANLLDYSTPVADIDYMHNYGVQCAVDLPGFITDHYIYLGSVDVLGSGWVVKMETPNGGHFSFLHIASPHVPTTFSPVFLPPPDARTGPLSLPIGTPTNGTQGDDNTAKVVGSVLTLPINAPTAGYYPGGYRIGSSQWPTDPYYGNGSCCAQDAHLCLLLDAKAATWFYNILIGAHKPPVFKFDSGTWYRYANTHHVPHSTVQAWYTKNPCHSTTCETWAASVWVKHKTIGGVKGKERYYTPKGGYAYMQTSFGKGVIRCWNHYHSCKVSKT